MYEWYICFLFIFIAEEIYKLSIELVSLPDSAKVEYAKK